MLYVSALRRSSYKRLFSFFTLHIYILTFLFSTFLLPCAGHRVYQRQHSRAWAAGLFRACVLPHLREFMFWNLRAYSISPWKQHPVWNKNTRVVGLSWFFCVHVYRPTIASHPLKGRVSQVNVVTIACVMQINAPTVTCRVCHSQIPHVWLHIHLKADGDFQTPRLILIVFSFFIGSLFCTVAVEECAEIVTAALNLWRPSIVWVLVL